MRIGSSATLSSAFSLSRTITLHALEFIRRFLQPVLPSGLMKVRYYGFLHPSCSIPLEEVKARIEMTYGFALSAPEPEPVSIPAITCRCCAGPLKYLGSVMPFTPQPPIPMKEPAVSPSG